MAVWSATSYYVDYKSKGAKVHHHHPGVDDRTDLTTSTGGDHRFLCHLPITG